MKRNRVKLSKNKKIMQPFAQNALFPKNPTLAIYVNQFILWDTSLCIHINRYSTNQMIATFFKTISRLGDGWFWYAMLLTAFALQGTAAILPLVVTMLISATGLAVYKILKIKTVRPRPYQVHQVIVLGERPLDMFSFPSGHTLQAVLFTATLGSYFPMLLPVMLPFAILVAISRIVLGLHYPTDVLIGAAIGYALSLWVTDLHQFIAKSLVVLGM
ncbi:phosphatase PAP2 family protein [Psychrobacter sp.]|uniref:phosphatase PAP2 family protein n=1 Tax=Psychrobacter sp. TaxID=56811 RepID=UPI003F947B3F